MGIEDGASLSEAEFVECLNGALYGEVVFSDLAPWGDLTQALQAVAGSSRPVPQMLLDSAWAVYRSHSRQPGRPG